MATNIDTKPKSTWAAITEYHRLDSSNNKMYSPKVLEAGSPGSGSPDRVASRESLFLAYKVAAFSFCPPCVCVKGEKSLELFLIRTLILLDKDPTFMTSFNLKYFL